MIAALLFAAMSRQGSVRTVDLSRGALIQSADSIAEPFAYWDTTDTYIDGSAPDDNFGGEPILAVGPSKTLLIRFGDLNRVLGSTRHIRKATLILTIAGGDTPALKSVDKLIVPWGAGPYFTMGALLKQAASHVTEPNPAKPKDQKPVAPRFSATWRYRLSGEGGAAWQQPGENGAQDSETIKDARATVGDKEVAVDGLTTTFQDLADHPNDNFGLAIRFQSSCEFYSSRASIGHPRLVLELEPAPPATGPDLSVTTIERISPSGGTPSDGEEVTYKAHVKNVGTAQAAGFSAQWVVNGKPAPATEVADNLAPGTETTFSMRKTFRLDKSDHRAKVVELRISPKGPDAVAGNNSLRVYENATEIDVQVPSALASARNPNLAGSAAIEDWVQEQVRVFNETYAAQSRFSFAPDGAKERVSVQHIVMGDSVPQDGAHADGVAKILDGEKSWLASDTGFLRSIGLACGLPDFTSMSFPSGKRILLKSGDKPVSRGTTDLYPGLIGYGDTRNECALAGPISLVYEPYKPLNSGLLPITPTGLLSATDVAVMNDRVERSDSLFAMPKTSLIRATDLEGHPLSNVQLDFFQSKGGEIPDGPPTFSTTTSNVEGTALLPNKGGLGPFGKLSADGGNGTFLIRATANGCNEWGWVKAWQLLDLASRGNTLAGIVEVRFDLPSAPLDPTVDLAKDRIISDSTNLLPAKLGTLVSGGTDKEVTLGGKAGDWVEIDLGRDRTIGEIALLGTPGAFWPKFDILVYGTGQSVNDAAPWATELNWDYASANRRDLLPSDPTTVSVAYRSLAVRIRFIRIVNRSSVMGILKGIRVVPVKIAP
jgi:hypothetical protein